MPQGPVRCGEGPSGGTCGDNPSCSLSQGLALSRICQQIAAPAGSNEWSGERRKAEGGWGRHLSSAGAAPQQINSPLCTSRLGSKLLTLQPSRKSFSRVFQKQSPLQLQPSHLTTALLTSHHPPHNVLPRGLSPTQHASPGLIL